MHLYRVYTSDEEIKEQHAPSSSYLYQNVRFQLRLDSCKATAAICKRVNEDGSETGVWIMTYDPFDKLRFSRWGADKAHRAVARMMFLWNTSYKPATIDYLFDMPAKVGKAVFSIEEV